MLTIKASFDKNNVIAQDSNLLEWFETFQNKKRAEIDPVLRAYNMLNLAIKEDMVKTDEGVLAHVEAAKAFPFSSIDSLQPPEDVVSKVLKMKQEINIDGEIAGSSAAESAPLTSEDQRNLATLLGLQPGEAQKLVQYVKGEAHEF